MLTLEEWLKQNTVNYLTTFEILDNLLGKSVFIPRSFDDLLDNNIITDFNQIINTYIPSHVFKGHNMRSNTTDRSSVADYMHFCCNLVTKEKRIPFELNQMIGNYPALRETFIKGYDRDDYLPALFRGSNQLLQGDEVEAFAKQIEPYGIKFDTANFDTLGFSSMQIEANNDQVHGVLLTIICDLSKRIERLEKELMTSADDNL